MKKKHLKRIQNNAKVLREVTAKGETLKEIKAFVNVYDHNLYREIKMKLECVKVGPYINFIVDDGKYKSMFSMSLEVLTGLSKSGILLTVLEDSIEDRINTIKQMRMEEVERFMGKGGDPKIQQMPAFSKRM